jgi:bifunctional oligoribonuclease and PAP phosphatase NrnA
VSADPKVDLTAYAAAVPDEVIERLKAGRRVLTICHENPEADALGSALAVALLVEANGGVATPVCADPIPAMYDFLPGMDRFRREPDPDIDYDLLVVGDCGELERIGPVLEAHRELFERVPILDIDHHLSNPHFGTVDWVDAKSSATCEMVTLLAWRMGVPLTAAGGVLATALAAGVVMDTGNFQHPNVTPRTLVVSAALREAGASLSEIARQVYRSKASSQLILFGRVLARLESDRDGRIVWSTLELADLTAAGAGSAESEGLVDMLAQARQADVAILFKEAAGETRISVRTREAVDATVLTRTFGGGGHARAAGATVYLRLPEARNVVLARAAELVDASRPSAEEMPAAGLLSAGHPNGEAPSGQPRVEAPSDAATEMVAPPVDEQAG